MLQFEVGTDGLGIDNNFTILFITYVLELSLNFNFIVTLTFFFFFYTNISKFICMWFCTDYFKLSNDMWWVKMTYGIWMVFKLN